MTDDIPMQPAYWHKQTAQPLFPDLLWTRPETKQRAGKLLVIGGHAQGFAAPAEAYTAAERAGIGIVRVLLPASLEKTVGALLPQATFAPSNPSGGFATQALAELCDAAAWADGTLLAGDFGRNSESLALLENFAASYSGQLTITKDAADFFCAHPVSLQSRPATLLVITTAQLQRLAASLHVSSAFRNDFGIAQLVELLHGYTESYPTVQLMTRHQNQSVVAVAGQVSTTPVLETSPVWRVAAAGSAAVWWLQNPAQPFAALTSSVLPAA